MRKHLANLRKKISSVILECGNYLQVSLSRHWLWHPFYGNLSNLSQSPRHLEMEQPSKVVEIVAQKH
jgi:hypothetical protein